MLGSTVAVVTARSLVVVEVVVVVLVLLVVLVVVGVQVHAVMVPPE